MLIIVDLLPDEQESDLAREVVKLVRPTHSRVVFDSTCIPQPGLVHD